MPDQAFFAALTWVDWIIIAIPAVCLLAGVLGGGTSLMHFGLVRFMTAWPLATVPALYVTYYQRPLIDQVAGQFGVTPIMASIVVNTVIFIVALIVIYQVLGIIWRGLRRLFAGSTIGGLVDRLLGIPAGLYAGALLCAVLAVAPGVQFRASLPSSDQPPGLRNSVLLPLAEEQMRGLARFVPPR